MILELCKFRDFLFGIVFPKMSYSLAFRKKIMCVPWTVEYVSDSLISTRSIKVARAVVRVVNPASIHGVFDRISPVFVVASKNRAVQSNKQTVAPISTIDITLCSFIANDKKSKYFF